MDDLYNAMNTTLSFTKLFYKYSSFFFKLILREIKKLLNYILTMLFEKLHLKNNKKLLIIKAPKFLIKYFFNIYYILNLIY